MRGGNNIPMITLFAFTVLFTPGPQYASELPFKFLGWRSGGRYAVLESEVGGVGPETQARIVVDAKSNKVVKRWSQQTESAERPVSAQSDAWMKQLPHRVRAGSFSHSRALISRLTKRWRPSQLTLSSKSARNPSL